MPPLDGKVALVTGASGGIGAAVARSLHDAGASVGLISRRGEDLGLERALGIACDVRDREAVERATGEWSSASAASTSPSRTPALAPTARSSSSTRTSSRR